MSEQLSLDINETPQQELTPLQADIMHRVLSHEIVLDDDPTAQPKPKPLSDETKERLNIRYGDWKDDA